MGVQMQTYPDGLIKKFNARLCARGDKQLEGTDFFDTYANDGITPITKKPD